MHGHTNIKSDLIISAECLLDHSFHIPKSLVTGKEPQVTAAEELLWAPDPLGETYSTAVVKASIPSFGENHLRLR
jgi:hypothetical protein